MNVKNEFTNVIQVGDELRTNDTVALGDRIRDTDWKAKEGLIIEFH